MFNLKQFTTMANKKNDKKANASKSENNAVVETPQVQQTVAAKQKVTFVCPFKGVDKAERRQKLRDLTNKLKEEAKAYGILDGANKLLIRYYKEQCGAPVLRTFDEWKAQGKNIRSGAAPFLLWDKMQPSNADSKEQADAEGRDQRTFFPMKFVYDIHQVYTPAFASQAAAQ